MSWHWNNGVFEELKISSLLGKTFTKIVNSEDEDRLTFFTSDGEEYQMYHSQDCCEHVYIEDIVGELDDLIGSPLLMAEEVFSCGETPEDVLPKRVSSSDSFTWTFYKFATIKGYVTIRWYGSSNGYYSETADLYLISED